MVPPALGETEAWEGSPTRVLTTADATSSPGLGGRTGVATLRGRWWEGQAPSVRVRLAGFKSPLSLSVWASYLTSLHISFLISR